MPEVARFNMMYYHEGNGTDGTTPDGWVAASLARLDETNAPPWTDATSERTGNVDKHNDPEMRDALIKGVAQYILRGDAHTTNPAHSGAQILARVRYDMAGVRGDGYTFPEGEAEKIAAEAQERARYVQDTNPDWDQWAFGH